jgi:hypothetical protein
MASMAGALGDRLVDVQLLLVVVEKAGDPATRVEPRSADVSVHMANAS